MDRLIGELLATLPLEQTLVAIVAHLGGTEKGRGHPTMRELVVPWILVGPGAARGRELTGPSIR